MPYMEELRAALACTNDVEPSQVMATCDADGNCGATLASSDLEQAKVIKQTNQ